MYSTAAVARIYCINFSGARNLCGLKKKVLFASCYYANIFIPPELKAVRCICGKNIIIRFCIKPKCELHGAIAIKRMHVSPFCLHFGRSVQNWWKEGSRWHSMKSLSVHWMQIPNLVIFTLHCSQTF